MGVPGGDAMRRLEPWAHEPRFESTNFPTRNKKDTHEECLFYYAENGGFEPPRAFTQHAFQAGALETRGTARLRFVSPETMPRCQRLFVFRR